MISEQRLGPAVLTMWWIHLCAARAGGVGTKEAGGNVVEIGSQALFCWKSFVGKEIEWRRARVVPMSPLLLQPGWSDAFGRKDGLSIDFDCPTGYTTRRWVDGTPKRDSWRLGRAPKYGFVHLGTRTLGVLLEIVSVVGGQ